VHLLLILISNGKHYQWKYFDQWKIYIIQMKFSILISEKNNFRKSLYIICVGQFTVELPDGTKMFPFENTLN